MKEILLAIIPAIITGLISILVSKGQLKNEIDKMKILQDKEIEALKIQNKNDIDKLEMQTKNELDKIEADTEREIKIIREKAEVQKDESMTENMIPFALKLLEDSPEMKKHVRQELIRGIKKK